jgi:DNA-binding protein H-NS
MTRNNYTAQKSRIQKEISKLEKQMQSLQSKQRKPVITSIVRSMREYDITPEEIAAAFGRKPAKRRATPSKAATAKRVIAPKYRHPDTKATWTGRGKPPRWISDAEAAGPPRSTVLIQAS